MLDLVRQHIYLHQPGVEEHETWVEEQQEEMALSVVCRLEAEMALVQAFLMVEVPVVGLFCC